MVSASRPQTFSSSSSRLITTPRRSVRYLSRRNSAHESWTGTPALAPLLDALAPKLRIPLRLGPLLRLAGLELAAFEQTLDVTRAVTCHGLSFLERSPGEATAEIAAILRGSA